MKSTCLILILATAIPSLAQTTRFIPAAASTPGANNTFWSTDARIYNPDPGSSIDVELTYLRGNTDNSAAVSVTVTIASRQSASFDDVIGGLLSSNGGGGILLTSSDEFYATSRTFNSGGDLGTYGQFIPAVALSDALLSGLLMQLFNDPADDGFRSNVGLLNPTNGAVEVTMRIFDASTAIELGTVSRTIQPFGWLQLNIFQAAAIATTVVESATVEFLADEPVFAYASVVDNTSGDPIYVTPFADDGTPATGSNAAPNGQIVSPDSDQTITAGDSVEFSGSAEDPDGDEVTVVWDFGDQMSSSELDPGAHTYSETGTFEVSLTATDEHGLADATPDTVTITVGENSPPDGSIDSPSGDQTIDIGDSVEFSGSVDDPDGDDVSVLWDFGDGTSSEMLVPGSHDYSEVGVYTVSFTATDSRGAEDPSPATVEITVEDQSNQVTLTQVQNAVFSQRCALSGCHAGSNPRQGMNLSAGLAFSNTVNVPSVERPELGLDRIEPFEPLSSYLYLKITGNSQIAGEQMPLTGGPLNQDQIDLVKSWIERGAPND